MFENKINDEMATGSEDFQRDILIDANISALLDESNTLIELINDKNYLKQIDDVTAKAKIISIDPKKITVNQMWNVRCEVDANIIKNWSILMQKEFLFPLLILSRTIKEILK